MSYPLDFKDSIYYYETGNAVITVRDFTVACAECSAFFTGTFHQVTQDSMAQIYIGIVNWDLPEFDLGYFADVDHLGHCYVTEAAEATIGFIFTKLGATRVRLEWTIRILEVNELQNVVG